MFTKFLRKNKTIFNNQLQKKEIRSFSMPYNLLAKSISTSNHMFERVIWDKLPKCIFEKFWNCLGKKRANSKISKIIKVIYIKYFPNRICDYWLITPNQQTLCIETNIYFLTLGNYKSMSVQLQNNTVNCAMWITTNCVTNQVIYF